MTPQNTPRKSPWERNAERVARRKAQQAEPPPPFREDELTDLYFARLQIGSAIILRLNPRRYRLRDQTGILESDLDRIMAMIDSIGEAGEPISTRSRDGEGRDSWSQRSCKGGRNITSGSHQGGNQK